MTPVRRGMTLLELLLASTSTATVALGIVGMTSALTDGIMDQHDTRASVLRAGVSQSRVSAYIARSRCLLDLEEDRIVLWLEDADGDEAVDGVEVRWLEWNPSRKTVTISWFADPGEILEEPFADLANTDWWAQQQAYGRMSSLQSGSLDLAGGITGWVFDADLSTTPQNRRLAALQRRTVMATYDITVSNTTRQHCIGESVRRHQLPDGGDG